MTFNKVIIIKIQIMNQDTSTWCVDKMWEMTSLHRDIYDYTVSTEYTLLDTSLLVRIDGTSSMSWYIDGGAVGLPLCSNTQRVCSILVLTTIPLFSYQYNTILNMSHGRNVVTRGRRSSLCLCMLSPVNYFLCLGWFQFAITRWFEQISWWISNTARCTSLTLSLLD